MNSNTSEPAFRPIDNSRKALLERSELLKQCRLEIERDLAADAGNSRNHVFPVLYGCCEKNSGNLFPGVEVGPQFVATYGPLRDFFDRQYMLSGNTTNPNPRADRPLGAQPENPRQRLLAPNNRGGALDRFSAHDPDSNAQTATRVNAQTARIEPQTVRMVTDSRKTFWQRLTDAWGARGLPTSQLGIARELGMSQGSVGRWARDEGLPELDVVRQLALKGDVCIEWLLTGRGPKRPMPVDEETAELLEVWRKLNANGRHHVRIAAQSAYALQSQSTSPPRPARTPSTTE